MSPYAYTIYIKGDGFNINKGFGSDDSKDAEALAEYEKIKKDIANGKTFTVTLEQQIPGSSEMQDIEVTFTSNRVLCHYISKTSAIIGLG